MNAGVVQVLNPSPTIQLTKNPSVPQWRHLHLQRQKQMPRQVGDPLQLETLLHQ